MSFTIKKRPITLNLYSLLLDSREKYPTLKRWNILQESYQHFKKLENNVNSSYDLLFDLIKKEKKNEISYFKYFRYSYRDDIDVKIKKIDSNKELNIKDKCIDQFLEPLLTKNIWQSDINIQLIKDIWILIIENNLQQKFKMISDLQEIKEIKIPNEIINGLYKARRASYGDFDIMDIIRDFLLYGFNFIPIIIFLKNCLNKFYLYLDSSRTRLLKNIEKINRDIALQYELDISGIQLNQFLIKIHFDNFYFIKNEKKKKDMRNLFKLINRLTDSTQIKLDLINYNHNFILENWKNKIIENKWNYCDKIFDHFRYIFINNFRIWKINYLIKRGIAWKQIDINEAITFKNKSYFLYMIKNSQFWPLKLNIDQFMDLAISQKWNEIIDYLNKFGYRFKKNNSVQNKNKYCYDLVQLTYNEYKQNKLKFWSIICIISVSVIIFRLFIFIVYKI